MKVLAASFLLAFSTPAVAATPHPNCPKTFTVAMAKRAARAVYSLKKKHVSMRERRMLGRIVRCQHNPGARPYVRGYIHKRRVAWLWNRSHPFQSALASWYDDSGGHCCGVYAYYGVADCGSSGPCYPQGTKIEFCLNGCIVATVDDHGPYVAGREWDLNQNTAGAIGFSGVKTVRWRLKSG